MDLAAGGCRRPGIVIHPRRRLRHGFGCRPSLRPISSFVGLGRRRSPMVHAAPLPEDSGRLWLQTQACAGVVRLGHGGRRRVARFEPRVQRLGSERLDSNRNERHAADWIGFLDSISGGNLFPRLYRRRAVDEIRSLAGHRDSGSALQFSPGALEPGLAGHRQHLCFWDPVWLALRSVPIDLGALGGACLRKRAAFTAAHLGRVKLEDLPRTIFP